MPSNILKSIFGGFLMLSAVLLWQKTSPAESSQAPKQGDSSETLGRAAGIFVTAGFSGVASGLVGIGGGVLLVPLLSLFFGFPQHRAQGTSLVALIPPTGLLAFLAYWNAGYVNWRTGLLLIPGVFLGGILGGMLARQLNPKRMRQLFAVLMLLLGVWQAFSVRR